MTIVAVTRILNEDDVVEAFVRHHATMVDRHLFLDNGSTDRTLEILRALKDEGVKLTVLQNKTPFFTEVSYNTSLFRQARMMFSADWVLCLDTDEFMDLRLVPDGLPNLVAALPATVGCVAIPSVKYVDLPADDLQEPVVPLRMRRRERNAEAPIYKILLRGHLATSGATVDAGQHQAFLDGQSVPSLFDHPLVLGHYYRRSAWQLVSKSVMGYLKVIAAGGRERNQGRSFHYKGLFEVMRDAPENVLADHFLNADYSEVDLIEDPLPYLGGRLRYTEITDPRFKAIRVLIAYSEQLAESHGNFIDTNLGVRLQAEHATSQWTQLI